MRGEIQEGGEVVKQRQQTALTTHRSLRTAELPVSFFHACLLVLACVLPCSSLTSEEHNLYDHFYIIMLLSHNV